MPRGGRRQGKPGQAYPNRSDLPTAPDPGAGTFKGQPYGAAKAQAQVQASGAPPGVASPPVAAPPGPVPGSFGAFNRPTERPGEPVTAGVDVGPGPGSEVLGMQGPTDPVSLQLRALYRMFPIPEIAELLED